MVQPPTYDMFDSCHMLTAEPSTYDSFLFILLETNRKTCHMLTAQPSALSKMLTCHILTAQPSTYDMFALIELYGRKVDNVNLGCAFMLSKNKKKRNAPKNSEPAIRLSTTFPIYMRKGV